YINLFINDKYKFLMIPPEVIFNDQLGKYVYIVDENETIQRADITTEYSSKYYVSVTQGLKDGDRLIVSALVKLKPRRKVKSSDVTKTQGIKAILAKNNLVPKGN
ncbi:efflux RND transporter periplasmic adaptor subunit, partial [Sulfurimonas sp. SAG-AH-194-L11]|nr:efflux RND transporter periplasmic adaptor subunit [Sulfurimonas sp. SAG-AH-194-L11]